MSTHVEHVETCVARIAAEPGHAGTALLALRSAQALAEAADLDLASAVADVSDRPLAGQVLVVKACFDVEGWTTHAGSAVLADAPPAKADAPIVAALRKLGAVVLAQTNMTEFAYGALGPNPTYGTATTPLYPFGERVSGGSTAGGAVAVTLGMADLALGSDTSGSARIPAAFCGVAGYKPSRGRYPEGGLLNLAPSFDVPAILARSAAACRRVDAALTGRAANAAVDLHGLRLAIPEGVLDDRVESEVADAFQTWVDSLTEAGATVVHLHLPSLTDAAQAARDGGVIPAEAYVVHRELLALHGDCYDPRVGPRIAAGEHVPAHRYIAARQRLAECSRRFDVEAADIGAVLTPTVGILPPRVVDLADDDAYLAINAEALRLTEFASRLDLPSISITGDLRRPQPVGLMLTGRRNGDVRLLDLAVAIEKHLSGSLG